MSDSPSHLQARSRALRKAMTPQERHLWYDFLKAYPVHFRRQQVFGNYIADFYCHQAKLVVELDGSQHFDSEEAAYDQKRTEDLNRMGIQVLRYANNQVNEEFPAVCRDIDRIVREKLNMQGWF